MTQEQKRAAIRQAVNQIVGKKKETTLPKDGIHDNIETADDSFTIGVGVGAKAKNYDVMDLESGEVYHFVEGSKVQDVKVFAGKSSHTPFRRASFFAKRYGGVAEDWQHVKGYALLETPDGDRMAEVHWVQCREIGKFEFFVKEWLD